MSDPKRTTNGTCPYCGGVGSFFCMAHDRLHAFVPGSFTYLRCSHCKSLFQSPMPDAATALTFYPGENYTTYTHEPSPRRPWIALGLLPTHGSFVDLGCGGGWSSKDFLHTNPGWDVTCIDLSPTAIDVARKILPTTTTFICADAERGLRNLPDGSVDLILAQDMIEHVPDPAAIFTEARRVLKTGGALLMSFPNGNSITATVFKSFAYHIEAPRHLTVPSVEGIRMLATSHQFSIHTMEGDIEGAMFWKSMPFSFARAGWAYRLRLVQLGKLLTKLFRRSHVHMFSMVNAIFIKT